MDTKKFEKIDENIFQYKNIRFYASLKLLQQMDEQVLIQAKNISKLPGLVGYVTVLADAHWGYGFPIGGSAAFDIDSGVISIGGVGFDINCGVRTLKTDLKYNDIKKDIEKLADILYKNVPAGLGSEGSIYLSGNAIDEILVKGAKWAVENGYGDENDLEYIEDNGRVDFANPDMVSNKAKKREQNQVGTLGSGNHYLEVQMVEQIFDENIAQTFGLFKNQIVISIHCGSRGLGHQIGIDYLESFLKNANKLGLNIPEKEIVYLPFKYKVAQEYFQAVNCGINYAFANREVLGDIVRKSFKKLFKSSKIELLYDVGHNTVKIEEHDIRFNNSKNANKDFNNNGKKKYIKKLIVHRKGATRGFGPGVNNIPLKYKDVGQPVIIGGDMGDHSYILSGTKKAMYMNFGTTVHGAGRVLSRHKARKNYRAEQEINKLLKKGIIIKYHSIRSVAEEIPQAYKDVEEVVNSIDKAGISKKVAKLKPIIVIKG